MKHACDCLTCRDLANRCASRFPFNPDVRCQLDHDHAAPLCAAEGPNAQYAWPTAPGAVNAWAL